MLGIGLTHDGLRQRLYGSLGPEEPPPSPEAYADLAASQVREVESMGHLAVIEGCSVSYGKSLVQKFGVFHALRLTWRERYPVHLSREVETTYRKLLDLDLYEETERNLDHGFGNSYPMSSLIYQPTIQVLRGKITRQQADELIVTKWIDEAIRADRAFANMGILPLSPCA